MFGPVGVDEGGPGADGPDRSPYRASLVLGIATQRGDRGVVRNYAYIVPGPGPGYVPGGHAVDATFAARIYAQSWQVSLLRRGDSGDSGGKARSAEGDGGPTM